ncbi:MAG: aspartate aminotransferase family protein [Pirellulales bacterium]|nr:aspartate aminotransferase family protein [Pirellulales bacterium]
MSPSEWTEAEKARFRQDALDLVIPHFASNENLGRGPKIFVRGEGCYVYDLDGKKYFDSFATLLTTVCGHCRPEVTEAVRKQMELLEFFPNYEDAFTVPLVELARKLAQIMPGDLSVSFFVNSGSEANETALKMARQFHVAQGRPHRFKTIARRGSYHATTLGGISVTGLPWFREYFEPLLPGCIFAPAVRDHERPEGMSSEEYAQRCLRELEDLILFEKPETIGAMILDPLPGSNSGYPLPPRGYLPGVRALCDKYGIVLIFDEVQTGFGKTGKWFFCEHEGVVPDIMTIGKGFTGGFIPLGAAVTTPRIAEVFRRGPGSELRSGSTYGGHTVACAATLANLAIIEQENLLDHAAELGEYLSGRLGELREKYPVIGDIRGIGLLWAVVLMADRRTRRPLDPKLGVGSFIREWCYRSGMILRNNGDILVLAPSLIITRDETDMVIDKIDQAIAAAVENFHLG